MDEPFASRQERLLTAAEAKGLEGLVIYSKALHSFVEMDGVWYASGFKPLGPTVMVLKTGADPVMFITPKWDEARARENTTCEIRAVGDLFADVSKHCISLGLSGDSIGLAGYGSMLRPDLEAFESVLGSGWTEFDEDARQVAVIKDHAEHELIRRSTWIAEEGWRLVLEELRPGMKEYELAGRLDVFMRELGADDNFLLVSAAEHNRSVHSPGERVLSAGDILLAEISPSYRGAFSQICRSVVIGEPTTDLLEGYEILRASYQSGLKACRPGATMGEVVEAVNEPIASAGFGEYCRPPYMRTRGHGMGLGSPFPITVSSNSSIEVKEGMTFVLHPNQYLPTVGYLLCGDHVLIHADAAEPLSARLAQLEVVGA